MLCCSDMGVEMPMSGIEKVLIEQKAWDKQILKRTGEDYFHKR